MEKKSNIIIGDESALFFHLHCDGPRQLGIESVWDNPLDDCFASAADSYAINANHPLYGGEPISVLVSAADHRRQSARMKSRCCPDTLPEQSFLRLRDGLYVASPELTYARMGNLLTETQLAEVATNLCGRYYIDPTTGKIEDRCQAITTPESLAAYLDKVEDMRGAGKARKALRWVLPNSGSPAETKMYLQYCLPLWRGGLTLPFTHMNYDVKAGRLAHMTEQSEFCIDLANPDLHEAMEYNGGEYHTDSGKDLRRQNALRALGWNIFVLDKSVLYDARKTKDAGLQVARHLGIRLQFPASWEKNYMQLRQELGLPL